MRTDREVFFEKLVREFGPKLYNLIRSIVLNHDDANDLLQETFLKAWTAFGTFRHEASMGTWLYRIALNEALRHEKKRSLRQRLRMEKPLQGELTEAPDTATILTAALATLTIRQRSIFAMHYFDHIDFSKIALLHGITENTAKSTYHQSANKIKKFIQEHV